MNWQEKVEVYPGADAGAATLGTLAAAGAQLRTNTDVAWTNQPLQVWANDDVIQSVRGPHGGLYRMVADADLTLWGGYSNQDALISLSRADVAGEPDAHVIELAATSDNWIYDGSVFIDANAASTGAAGNFNAQVNVAANNATITTQVLNRVSTAEGAWIDVVGFAAQTNAFNFRISDAGGPITQFSPMVADGASAVAYLFDTSNTLANATARINSWRNNGSEKAFMLGNGSFRVGEDEGNVTGDIGAGRRAADGYSTCLLQLNFVTAGDTPTALLECQDDYSDLNLRISGNHQIDAFVTSTILKVTGETNNVIRWRVEPTVADGATAIAYLFDTRTALANAGARIADFSITGTRKASIDVNGAYFVGVNQVVGARVVDARIDDAINSGDATTDGVIDACRDALIAHGLCTAA